MTVDELIDRLQMIRLMNQNAGKCNIVIPVEGYSFGPIPCVEISGVYQGFDWNRGKLFLNPVNKLKTI
jgi:hypothetical protein